MKQYEIKVTGRVQGVWFRAFTKEKAIETGINGWVKNTPDGHVLVVARGEKTDLDTFTDYLRIGPPMARVDKLFISEMNISGDFDNFSIKY